MQKHPRHWMTASLIDWPARHSPAALRAAGADANWRCVAPGDHDAEALAVLMVDSYRGTIDDEPGGATIEFARDEVRRLLSGEWGEFRRDCSFVAERNSQIASAALVTIVKGAPFLAFSMTCARCKRQGLARAGLERVMHTLAERAEQELSLVVTEGNTAAERLYEQMGFKRKPRPQ